MAPETLVGGADFQLTHTEGVGSFVQKQRDRMGMLKDIVHVIGPVNTGRAIYDRVRRGDYGRNDIVRATAPEARFPLHIGINPSDLANYNEIFRDDVYALPTEIADTVDGKPIVDLGAFIGLAAASFASRYPRSPITSVEPNPRNYELLEMNTEAYGEQVTPMFAAISPTSGVVAASHPQGSAHDYMSIHFAVDEVDLEPVPVGELPPAVTPGDIAAQVAGDTIGILKIDIEGAERALFLSEAIDELLSRTAVLMVETHDRFIPGCTEAVQAAAERNQLAVHELTPHTNTFLNPDFIQV